MKFKEGARVIVKRVPDKAAGFVSVGEQGIILPLGDAEKTCRDLKITRVRLNRFEFFWPENDLEFAILDKGTAARHKPSKRTKKIFSFGYDPYNSAHANSIYLSMRLGGYHV
jgi:hypothetical protein